MISINLNKGKSMFDPVSLSVAAGLVWIGESLIKKYKDLYGPKSIHTVPAYA